MGYSTAFKGRLDFTEEVTGKQLAHLNEILGEDVRDHPEWGSWSHLHYVDLQITDDFAGIEWSGAEKTYGMEEAVKLVLKVMRKGWPEFGLRGRLDAQGEDIGDLWALVVDGGSVERIDFKIEGREVECPHCEQTFVLDPEIKPVTQEGEEDG